METLLYSGPEQVNGSLARPSGDMSLIEPLVKDVLQNIKRNGQAAVETYTMRFDKVQIKDPLVSETEVLEAGQLISPELKAAIQVAKKNIEAFHAAQIEQPKVIDTMPGVSCWRKSVAIENIGLYIPGGTAPLFSTILMLGIPARLAGCRRIILCTPPGPSGTIHPAILYTAQLIGIETIFKTGGVQAIAAMAYGTELVPKVDKIFGPGNRYVTCAKQLISKEGIAIDLPAGPSEVAVLADDSCIPAFVAADLLSQAEHGEDSQVILVSPSEEVIRAVNDELQTQLELLPRKEIAAKALENSKAILVKNYAEALELLNAYAPEHLIIACHDANALAEGVINAGSVFLGNYSCESAGDYASGTNHTLPTNGYARAYSGVSLDSFVKKITFQKLTREGIASIGPAIELMAQAEGLDAHRQAVTLRLKTL